MSRLNGSELQVPPPGTETSLPERGETEIGRPSDRAEGRLKVTGQAKYTAAIPLERCVYAEIAHSTIANGRVVDVEAARAEAAPGVLTVLTHRNTPHLAKSPTAVLL